MKTKHTMGMSIAAALLLTFGLLFMGCIGSAGGGPGGGSGITIIEIYNLTQLQAIDDSAESMSWHYKLMADITGVTAPIGSLSGGMPTMLFTGEFDGNGHTITLNINSGLNVPSGPYPGTFAGLFAAVGALTGNPGTAGLVHDLKVAGTINSITGDADIYVGGVAGAASTTAVISNVASSVNVTVSGNNTATEDQVSAGGVLGAAQGVVNKVYATGNVTASHGCHVNAGGVLGTAEGATVSNVYATGNVTATTTSVVNHADVSAGGIVGNAGSPGSVNYAYATGTISVTGGTGTGTSSSVLRAGGIVGEADTTPVRYTVALNGGVTADGTNYTKYSYRIASTSSSVVGPNYGKANLTPACLGTGGTSYSGDTGATNQDGTDVTVTPGTPYTAPDQTWWQNTGFLGANWTTVWQWDTTSGLPKLR